MKRSARLKKRFLLIFLIPVGCLLIVATDFLIHYRFRESISYLVTRESKGQYAFDARDASISLWRGTVILKGSQLSCLDTTGTEAWCNLRTPQIYCSLSSWKALLFDKKLILDSIAIIGASLDVHVVSRPEGSKPPWHIADLAEKLKTTLQHLNVHAFSLKDLSFTWHGPAGTEPLHTEHIDISVSNFARFGHTDSHLLGSDEFSIALGREHWALAGGRQLIDFARLTFDSKGHRFAMDSFSFRQPADTARGEFRLTVPRFFFNSNRLPAVYEKDGQLQLLLDTLVCINPVLSIPQSAKENQGEAIQNLVRQTIYRWINVRFVQVIDGRLLVRNKADHADNASTRKANLRIYNLTVDPYGPKPLTSDSIRMSFNNIEFLTRDSAYKLSIGQLAIRGDDALFKQVSYGPTIPGNGKSVVFTAPLLWLRDIDLPDLLRKHLKASSAELIDPTITMTDNLPPAPKPHTPRDRIVAARKLALFYRTLHNIHELIDAPDFLVTGGAAAYTHTGKTPIDAQVVGLKAHILLNKFFGSDSLVAIKRAIPSCHIDKLTLNAGGLHLSVDQYGFEGIDRKSLSRMIRITTDGGWQIRAKNTFWNVLDWDRFEKTREVSIDSLHLDELTLHAPPRDAGTKRTGTMHRDTVGTFPVIRVHTLDLGGISFEQPSPPGPIHFSGDYLHAANIRTEGHSVVWGHAIMRLHDLGLRSGQTAVEIKSALFDSDHGLAARDIRLTLLVKAMREQPRPVELSIPAIHWRATLHSSDWAKFPVSSLATGDIPFNYNGLVKKDTFQIAGILKLDLQKLQLFPKLTTAVDLSWKDTDLHLHSDSMKLDLKGMSGSLHDNAFTGATLNEKNLEPWLARIAIGHASLHYSTSKLTAEAASCSWDPVAHAVGIAGFHILPRLSREETFKKARWQQDYVTVKGRALTLSGIKLAGGERLTSVGIDKLVLDGVSVDASRDRHLPFHHGIEKPMPTKLLDKVPFDIHIDTALLINDDVTYNELSPASNRWSTVHIASIDGSIKGLKTRDNTRDTLKLDAHARLFDGHIRRFDYRESYGDSLSSFTAKTTLAAVDLKKFSEISIPAAAVSITGGYVDTAWSTWQGNRYAAYGTMNFYFNKLRIKVLNKKDSLRRGVVPELETWAARILLPGSNKRTSEIFFERDREKFVFNYWVKTQASGILAALVREKQWTYRKRYDQLAPTYSLPPRSSR
ncbi:MAG TPA: hypothetical protein VGS79_08965 [Puia sp.]|nr:hypothetical protein [Puia sp.]